MIMLSVLLRSAMNYYVQRTAEQKELVWCSTADRSANSLHHKRRRRCYLRLRMSSSSSSTLLIKNCSSSSAVPCSRSVKCDSRCGSDNTRQMTHWCSQAQSLLSYTPKARRPGAIERVALEFRARKLNVYIGWLGISQTEPMLYNHEQCVRKYQVSFQAMITHNTRIRIWHVVYQVAFSLST